MELATAPEAGALIARYVGADAVRLSPAALETLAIVAYRQPVTKGAIERIRGVDSDYTVRALLHRRLVVEQGRSEAPGRPILYGTGFEFLERFGLASLEELPLLDLDIAARLVDGDDDERPRRPTAMGQGSPTRPSPTGRARRSRRRGLSRVPPERISKVLAAAGVASRRGADELVTAGRVRVDGRLAVLGERVDPGGPGDRGRRHRHRRRRPGARSTSRSTSPPA